MPKPPPTRRGDSQATGDSSNGTVPDSTAAQAKAEVKRRKPRTVLSPTVTYRGSISPPSVPLPRELAEGVKQLQEAMGMPVWMLLQTGNMKPDTLDYSVLRSFLGVREQLAADGHVALLVDSPGGLGDVAYQMARILQRDGGFTVVIPRYAKSAATLLSLGAHRAIMGEDAEIGPLDAQLWDAEREEPGSALNEVQALDQLHTVALEHLDKTMMTMLGGTKKRTDVLLPLAAKFVSDMMRPMLEKIDAVHYAKQSRILAVAEHYAIRLICLSGVPREEAREIADTLVNRYPEHGFVIDRQEVEDLRLLRLVEPADDVREAVARVERALWRCDITTFGKLEEHS